jgi:hypothetical protein
MTFCQIHEVLRDASRHAQEAREAVRVCYTFRFCLLEMSSHLAQFVPMAARN